MNPAEALAAEIRSRRAKWIESKKSTPTSYPTNRASELGHPCLRYLVFLRTKGETAEPTSNTLQSLYREGEVHERDVKRVLDELGFDPFGSQETFPPNNYQISGHIDCQLTAEVGVEIKSLNDYHWQAIDVADDMLTVGPHWIAKWYVQSSIYAFLKDLGCWLWIIKNKTTGEWKNIPLVIDYQRVERYVDKAEIVNRFIEDNRIPETIKDPSLCRRCKFYQRACYPAEEYGAGFMVVSNEELIALVDQCGDDQHAKRRYDGNWKTVREAAQVLANGNDRQIVVGNYILDVRHHIRPGGAKSARVSLQPLKPEDT